MLKNNVQKSKYVNAPWFKPSVTTLAVDWKYSDVLNFKQIKTKSAVNAILPKYNRIPNIQPSKPKTPANAPANTDTIVRQKYNDVLLA
mmetsp:Transcript_2006/g.2223  ORF Transcript_2006/g.2223 Transcript_2006/m.2223 type:complete len:88 (-) Transcript_2006:57-320(-)